MTPLAYLILDRAGRIVDAERPGDHKKLAASVARLNEHSEANAYRLVPVAEIPAWQPIESAPRDGTRFLAFSPFGSQNMDIVSWNDEADSWADFSGAWWPGGDLTHWQPLPAPPKEDA